MSLITFRAGSRRRKEAERAVVKLNPPPYFGGYRRWGFFGRRDIFALGIALLAAGAAAGASTLRPYAVDADTIHLWHMNDQAVPVIDNGSDGTHLAALRNGATLGNVSYRGFGTALSTYDGGPESTNDAGHDAYLAVHPLVNGPADNVAINYCGVSGAFTFEAMVRVDFDPEVNVSTNVVGTNHGTFMQLINLDADENTNRVCQFRIVPTGLFNTNAGPLLEFINLNKDKSPQGLMAPIPMSGGDAIKFGSWYHVAVTFSGNTNQADNLRFYWTLVDPSRAKANQIGSGQLVQALPQGCAPDFAIGQTGRQSPTTPYPNQNFPGLIDEVRISAVARSDSQMLFDGQQIATVAAATPVAVVPVAETASTQNLRAPLPAALPEKAKPQVEEGPKTEATSWTDKITGANLLISAALIIIAGLLFWLLYVLRKLVFSARTVVAVSPQQAAVNTALHDASTMLQEVDSLISQANDYQAKKRSGSTTRFKKKPVEEEVDAENVEPGSEVGFQGVIRKIGLEDLIQLECMNCKSSLLEIKNQKMQGKIYIERGEIIHAEADGLTGEPALFRILGLRGGQFSLKAAEATNRRTINGQWMGLLMEAAQARDEETTFIKKEEEEKSLNFAESASTPEEMVAMATLLGEHPHVKELVLVASEGSVLYSSKCPDSAARATTCNELLEVAKAVSANLPLGEFHHLEIVNNQSRTVIQPAQGHHLMIGTPADATSPLG